MAANGQYAIRIIEGLLAERASLLCALRDFRRLVNEGGVPRYQITPGAALNSLIEETVDPCLKAFEDIAQ